MFKRAMTVPASAFVVALVGCSSTHEVRSGALANGHTNDDDEQVTLEQCPAAVQATILEHANGAPIVEIERTTDHGEVLFEVDAQGSEGIFEFDVAENGEFRSMETDDDDDDDDNDDDDDDVDDDDDDDGDR
jgi:hypothetical protein